MTDLKMTDLQFSESSRTGCCSAADNDTAAAGVWNAFRAVPKNGSDRDSRKAFAGAVSADLLKDAKFQEARMYDVDSTKPKDDTENAATGD